MCDLRKASLEEFVQRTAQDDYQQIVKKERALKHLKTCKWQRKNVEKMREINKKYRESEKGKEVAERIKRKRLERMKKAKEGTTQGELFLIREFYKNCPLGYCVDHIVPLCQGGKHKLSNLQYLTPLENFSKGTKNMQEYFEYRHIVKEIDSRPPERITSANYKHLKEN